MFFIQYFALWIYIYITQNHLLVNEKKEMQGWLNTSLKRTEIRDELLITLYLRSKINFCSVRMPVNA